MSDVAFRQVWRPQTAGAMCRSSFLPWVGQQVDAGQSVVVEARLEEDSKTDRQRRYLHGVVLTTIAQQARPNGEGFSMAAWKEHFRQQFLGFKTVTHVNPMTGKRSRRRQRISTEDLGVKAYAAYIDKVIAFAAEELGVVVPVPFAQWEGAEVDPHTGEILGA